MVVQAVPPVGGIGGPGSRAGRGNSQDGGSRSRRDDSATSQPGGVQSQPQTSQPQTSSPSNQQQSPQ